MKYSWDGSQGVFKTDFLYKRGKTIKFVVEYIFRKTCGLLPSLEQGD